MKKNDIMRNVLIGASASIPYVGGSVSCILDKIVPEYITKQYDELLTKLEKEFIETRKEVSIASIQNPEFITICQKAIDHAIVECFKEKKQAYRNIMLNAIIGDIDYQISDFFFRLTDELSETQFMVLLCAYYADLSKVSITNVSQLMKMFQNNNMLVLSIISELTRLRLTKGTSITKLGRRYCEFINSPQKILPTLEEKLMY